MPLPTAARASPSLFALGAAGTLVAPSSAAAHVKWFCATADATQAPVPLPNVLTATFFLACGAFVLLVFAGLVADGYVARRWPALASTGARLAKLEEAVIRLAVAIYFLALWNGAAAVPWAAGEAVLTPELVPRSGVLGILQLTIAILVIRRETCIFAAFGMCVLYANATLAYGVFHMLDYVFFPGLAAYLALTWAGSPRALRMRVPVLCGSLSFSLMWRRWRSSSIRSGR